jgi:hypothetical protein
MYRSRSKFKLVRMFDYKYEHRNSDKITRRTLPSSLLPRSVALYFFPLTASGCLGTWVADDSRLTISLVAFCTLTTCDSGRSSGGINVCSVRALRCLLAFGCDVKLSEDDGLGLRLVLLFDAKGGAVEEGENMMRKLN